MYYTNEHEWIEYRGYTALVGICLIKLCGKADLQRITFCDTFLHSGLNAYEVYMPVDGKIVSFNKKLLDNPSLILNEDQESTWIVKISPNALYKRDGLLQAHQYKLLNKKGKVYC